MDVHVVSHSFVFDLLAWMSETWSAALQKMYEFTFSAE